MTVEIRRLRAGDTPLVLAAGGLFDSFPDVDATDRFLASPGHHLLLAIEDDEAVGFVTGVEMTHPDKGTELFLYELAVAEAAWRRGIGTQLVEALRDLAVERGCYGMWVLTDEANAPAVNTYRRARGFEASRPMLFGWKLGPELGESGS